MEGGHGVLGGESQHTGLREHMGAGPAARAGSTEGFTCAMSHTVTLGSREARSKQCTVFRILEASLQSPQPKSATTRDAGLRAEGRGQLPGWGKPRTDPHSSHSAPPPFTDGEDPWQCGPLDAVATSSLGSGSHGGRGGKPQGLPGRGAVLHCWAWSRAAH